MTNTIVIRNNR